MTAGLCSNTAAALDGSGTQQDPWRIQSLEDFNDFAADANYWDDYTRLETDVNLAGQSYSTAVIAPDTDANSGGLQGTKFTGVFDGNDHKIIGLTIDDGGAGNDFLGLFGLILDGEVRNLGLEGGFISGGVFVGGLVGWNHNNASVSNCYSIGDVNGVDDVGGLVGYNIGVISNCSSTGDVSGTRWVGGLVGLNKDDGSVSNCYSTSNVSGTFGSSIYVGGLLGSNSGSLSNCYSTGDVSGERDVGGLVGANGDSVSNCYSTGDVSGTGNAVGGLAGSNSSGSVSNCYSIGDVNGVDDVGGLVGANYSDGSVSNCYSTGDVNGVDDVGGLVGQNGYIVIIPPDEFYFPGYINNSYSAGWVVGDSNVGGLVGGNQFGDIESSFWNVETSRQFVSDGGTGKTTAQMQTKSTFTDAGWDFMEIWLINDGATYPLLRQEIRSDLDGGGVVNLPDVAIFADHWLEGTGN
jgi:hypothetical protein